MSWKFNPPPGWPEQPAGWVPPAGWTPDPAWPPPPAGWQFWVAEDWSGATAPSQPLGHTPPPAQPPAPAQPVGPAQPPGPAPPVPPYAGQSPPPPYQQPYGAGPAAGRKLWFARWWGILGLVGALLVGALVGFAGTSLALADDDDPAAPPSAPAVTSPTPGTPEQTEPPELSLPSPPPLPTAPPADVSEVCGQVAVIMVVMLGEQLRAPDADDPRAALADSRRTAAESLRDIDADGDEQAALEVFADELDEAADYLEQGAFTERRVDEFLTRTTDAWNDFNDAADC